MANCRLKTDARILQATDNRTLPSAVSRNTVATTTTTTSEITRTGRFHIARIEKRQKSGTSSHTENGKMTEIRRGEEKKILATSTVVSKGTGMRATGTGRPTSPGTTTVAATTSSGTGGTINGTARKWKTQAADDRTHTQNRIMIIGQTGTVRWTTASHGPTTSTWGKATTSGATTARADRSTSSGLNCCTEAPRVASLTGTASPPQSAAKHGVCTGDQQAVTYTVGKETRATPAETHTTSPTPATLYPAAGRTVKSSNHVQTR